MPLFGGDASPFDEIIEKATTETKTSEDWGLIMDICDKISQAGSKGAKDGLLSIKKRLNHRDPHVIMLALSVLDSCWSNCGQAFRQEVSSREMCAELRCKATYSNYTVGKKTLGLLAKWADDECRSDASLALIASLRSDLRQDGAPFDEPDDPAQKKSTMDPKAQRKEEDDIARAIEMSLNESKSSNMAKSSSGRKKESSSHATITSAPLYPSASGGREPDRVVKALYDFEAAEENELSFCAGDHITILDDGDMNWWKGRNSGGSGLFPASFVTADLTATVEASPSAAKRTVQFDDEVRVQEIPAPPAPAVVDEAKLAACLDLLKDADPTGDRPEPPELGPLEAECAAMGPLIDLDLASVDRETNLLAEVDVKLRDALALYNTAMEEATHQLQAQMHAASLASYSAQQPQYQPPADAYAQYAQQPSLGQAPSIPTYGAPPPQGYVPQYQQ